MLLIAIWLSGRRRDLWKVAQRETLVSFKTLQICKVVKGLFQYLLFSESWSLSWVAKLKASPTLALAAPWQRLLKNNCNCPGASPSTQPKYQMPKSNFSINHRLLLVFSSKRQINSYYFLGSLSNNATTS